MAPPNPYKRLNRADLEAEVTRRGLTLPETGSGADDGVVNADLEQLLVDNDGEVTPGTPKQTGRPELGNVAEKRAARRAETVRVIGADTTTEDTEESDAA